VDSSSSFWAPDIEDASSLTVAVEVVAGSWLLSSALLSSVAASFLGAVIAVAAASVPFSDGAGALLPVGDSAAVVSAIAPVVASGLGDAVVPFVGIEPAADEPDVLPASAPV